MHGADELIAFLQQTFDADEEALLAGVTSMWAPEDKPYGERSAGVTDAWGNQWYIATPLAR